MGFRAADFFRYGDEATCLLDWVLESNDSPRRQNTAPEKEEPSAFGAVKTNMFTKKEGPKISKTSWNLGINFEVPSDLSGLLAASIGCIHLCTCWDHSTAWQDGLRMSRWVKVVKVLDPLASHGRTQPFPIWRLVVASNLPYILITYNPCLCASEFVCPPHHPKHPCPSPLSSESSSRCTSGENARLGNLVIAGHEAEIRVSAKAWRWKIFLKEWKSSHPSHYFV